MAHKNLFHNNPTQNAMENAYEEMLKEENQAGVDNNTANFFEDIIVESIVPTGVMDSMKRVDDNMKSQWKKVENMLIDTGNMYGAQALALFRIYVKMAADNNQKGAMKALKDLGDLIK
jgi:hypothetical protein